jgi:hypothetical protein
LAIVGRGRLQRLERLRDLLVERDERAAVNTELLLCSGRSFNSELTQAADGRDDVELVDLKRLYEAG